MKCDPKDLLLYAVTDRHWLNGRTLVDVVKESLDGGVTMIQLREKSLDEGKFLEEAKELQALCRERHVPFIVNDNVDIAKAMDADGVHVGQDDMAALALPVTILGGALYHLIFEAKAQYAYPYMVYMLPLAAIGLCRLEEGIKGLWKTKERRR